MSARQFFPSGSQGSDNLVIVLKREWLIAVGQDGEGDAVIGAVGSGVLHAVAQVEGMAASPLFGVGRIGLQG